MSELEYTEQGWRYTTDTTRHHRTNEWDYSGVGIYHFTLVVAERYPLFGQLAGVTPNEAYIELSDLGTQVLELLRDEPRYYGEKGYTFKILASMVMPDHIHVAIQVLKPLPKSIGTVVRGFKSACTSLYKQTYATNGCKYATKGENVEDSELPAGSDLADLSTGSDLPFSRIFTRIGSIWQPDSAYYHDRIIHGYSQIDSLIRYIKDNPRRLALKRAKPELFRIRQEQRFGAIVCTALGNIFLAEHPQREVLQCSRKLTQADIDAKREECLRAAANGTVYVSAAISEGEKQISRALREAGYEMIILLTEGFPAADSPHYKYFKPQGVCFETCAAGKLLLIEPAAEMFERAETEAAVYAKTGIHDLPHTAQRYRFLALNAMAEELCRLTEK